MSKYVITRNDIMDLQKPKETVFQFRTYYEFLDLLDELCIQENVNRTELIHRAVLQYKSEELSKGTGETITLSEEEKKKCEKLFETLNESDSVQEIYSNTNF